MARREHQYAVTVNWTGKTGDGAADYLDFDRTHRLIIEGKPEIIGSADPAFRGNPTHWNPEELLVAALSACHKLWYLHLCAENGIVVTAYRDDATGLMEEDGAGGRFVRVVLRPQVTITKDVHCERADSLHAEASARCFIRNSVNFPVAHEATTMAQDAQERTTC